MPKYQVIAEWLEQKIAEGSYRPGEKLPSEQELRDQFDVSRQTVRRALEVLEEQGLTYGQQGKGTFVTDPALEEQNKSRQIAVVTTYVDNYIFPRIIQGIEQILSAEGFQVQIAFTNNRIQKETEMILLPNEQMTLNKEERRMKKEIKTASDAKKWTTGQLFFDETPLIEVAKTLERSYNTQITFGNESLKECLFCGSFNRTEQNIKDILEALRKTGKIHYTIDNKNITLY